LQWLERVLGFPGEEMSWKLSDGCRWA
jgi:hypothetical protein